MSARNATCNPCRELVAKALASTEADAIRVGHRVVELQHTALDLATRLGNEATPDVLAALKSLQAVSVQLATVVALAQ